jgi:hypothetical protein
MGELGIAILNAMRDQGWFVMFGEKYMTAVPPEGPGAALPVQLFDQGQETRLRIILLNLIVTHGLVWPWPPDHREEVHGEVPRSE